MPETMTTPTEQQAHPFISLDDVELPEPIRPARDAAAKAVSDFRELLNLASVVVGGFMRSNDKLVDPAFKILREIDARATNQYHGSTHTGDVMKSVVVLWAAEKDVPINWLIQVPFESYPQEYKTELTELLCAAAYLDIGRLQGAQGHEQRGADLAQASLTPYLGEEAAARIASYIPATRMEFRDGMLRQVKAENLEQRILQDADMSNLGGTRPEDQWKVSCALFQETSNEPFKAEYANSLPSISFAAKLFAAHEYQTDAGRRLLNPGKAANLAMLRLTENDLTRRLMTM